jgi:hypothetical protein
MVRVGRIVTVSAYAPEVALSVHDLPVFVSSVIDIKVYPRRRSCYP